MHRLSYFFPLAALRWLLTLLALAAACGALAGSPGAASQGRTLDATRADAAPTPLTPWFDVLEDPAGTLTLEEVRSPAASARFTPSGAGGEALNFGLTASAWWLRLRLANPGDAAIDRLLEVAYARLSHLDFYAPQPDGSYREVRTGTTLPFESRGYAHRHFVFELPLAARSEHTLYLRIATTTGFIVPARLWAPAAFRTYERSDYVAQALYFGIAAAMLLFNLLLFVRLKDWLYLQYCGFALSMAFALAAQNGLVKEYLRLQSPLWSDVCTSFGYSLALAIGMLFLRRMLETPAHLPRLDPWLRGFVAFFLLSPLLFLVSVQTFIKPAAVIYLLAMVILMAVAGYCAWRGQRSAYFFFAAFTLPSLGSIIYTLRALGLVPTNLVTAHAMQVGSALEMVLLALALADRFNQIRREKAAVGAELVATQQQLIETLRSNEQRLEQHVADRTLALEEANRRLEALSRTDGLTGIANRRRFDEVLAQEWQRAQRSGQPLTLALLDVDWFKHYNDHYGHLAGDECLRAIAGVLAASVGRPSDLVARYGGEEFAVLAPATDAAGVVEIAQRIQAGLQALALPHAASVFTQVTVSIGVAAMAPGPHDSPRNAGAPRRRSPLPRQGRGPPPHRAGLRSPAAKGGSAGGLTPL